MNEKLTLALSPDVVAIIRRAGGKRGMGKWIDALVRRAENPEPGKGLLERIDENLAALVEQKSRK